MKSSTLSLEEGGLVERVGGCLEIVAEGAARCVPGEPDSRLPGVVLRIPSFTASDQNIKDLQARRKVQTTGDCNGVGGWGVVIYCLLLIQSTIFLYLLFCVFLISYLISSVLFFVFVFFCVSIDFSWKLSESHSSLKIHIRV